MYVSPEQLMKDRAEFAKLGVAKGRSAIVMRYQDGIAFIAENRSKTLHKISEIYDRIGFAAVGRYNQFENLRIAGIRWADLRGFSYDRQDVSARSLANAYAQTLGSVFAAASELPFEVELAVAELGKTSAADRIYKISYDGSVSDFSDFAVLGSDLHIGEAMGDGWHPNLKLEDALRLGSWSLAQPSTSPIEVDSLEAAVLDRNREQTNKFRRLFGDELRSLVAP